MREIKFRAWNRRDGRAWGTFGLGEDKLWLGDTREVYAHIHMLPTLDHWVLMQFTGLTDKDGKEIYEGDVLGGYPHATVEVIWDRAAACFATRYFVDDDDDDGGLVKREITDLLSNSMHECGDVWTVIGNVYENPELLNAETD